MPFTHRRFHVGALLLHGIYHRDNSFSDKIIQMHTFSVHTCTHTERRGRGRDDRDRQTAEIDRKTETYSQRTEKHLEGNPAFPPRH